MHDKNWYWKPGAWNVLCPVCGFKFKSDELKLRWDGEYVCEADWEPKHPQDLFRVTSKESSIPWSKPETITNDTLETISVAGTYNLSATIRIVQIDATAGNVIVRLPQANFDTFPSVEQFIQFIRTDSSSNTVTISRSIIGSDIIDNGATSITLNYEGQVAVYFIASGRWRTVRG